jgi:hypothetical protein
LLEVARNKIRFEISEIDYDISHAQPLLETYLQEDEKG